MLLTFKVLNHDATLNNWGEIGSAKIVRGSAAKIVLQIFQPEKKIRYIPASGATLTVAFLNSDGTTLNKSATFAIADDRSIVEINLTASETATLISQNLIGTLTEGGVVTIILLQQGLQMLSTMDNC
jgi:hypothetical protein